MTSQQVQQLLEHPRLTAYTALIEKYLHPSVDISMLNQLPLPQHSRFGGEAYVPADFVWPQHPEGDYYFLGQIDCAEIINRPPLLPAHGLLAFFFAQDAEGEVFWGDEGYVRAYYWPDCQGFRLYPQPPNAALASGDLLLNTASRRIVLQGGMDLPLCTELYADDEEAGSQLLRVLQDEGIWAQIMGEEVSDHLLGYPFYQSLAYDPTPPDGNWLPLLCIASHDVFWWNWHDDDYLTVFIEYDTLAAGDFSVLRCDAG